jgi:outer membrane biosynthesis protein TonB
MVLTQAILERGRSMKHITLIAVLVVLPGLSAPSYAQGEKPAAKPAEKATPAPAAKAADKPKAAPAAKPEAKPAAAAPAPKPVEKPAAAPVEKPAKVAEAAPAAKAPSRKRDTRDARECLQHATNPEISKCAEKYR